MEYSIIGIFNFGIFGIPHVGSDICGFIGNTNEELCTRWMQLGTLYPFSRNHNDNLSIPQEPWAFGEKMLITSKMAIRNRYSLMLYFYTEMFYTGLKGELFFKPAYFEYPDDYNLLVDSSSHFMLGHSLIVHPCLWEGITGMNSYFPTDLWYNLYDGSRVNLDKSSSIYLDMPLHGLINIHIRGGSIVPMLDLAVTALTVEELRNSSMTLVVALDSNQQANGRAVFDDGISANTLEDNLFTIVDYSWHFVNYTTDVLSIQPSVNGFTRPSEEFPHISTLFIFGCAGTPISADVVTEDATIHAAIYYDWNSQPGVFKVIIPSYNEKFSPDKPSQVFIRY